MCTCVDTLVILLKLLLETICVRDTMFKGETLKEKERERERGVWGLWKDTMRKRDERGKTIKKRC